MTQALRQAVPQEARARSSELFAGYDAWLMGAWLGLLGLGLVMVASASITVADRTFHDPFYYFWRQSVAAILGLAAAYVVMQRPVEQWYRAGSPLLFVAISLLLLVLVPGLGREVNGSMRWLRLGPVSLQASEPVKLCIIVYLAGYLVRHGEEVRESFAGLFKPMCVLTVIAILLLREPDYGVTVLLFATTLGLLFISGVSLVRFTVWGTAGAAAMAGLAIMAPYRVQRLMAFLDPWADPFNQGFQLVQALIAFGRGEWTGVGLGGSIQKLFYLPEAHTDFIFAVLAEELGLLGTVTVIVVYGFVVLRAFAIGDRAERAGQVFSAYLAYGIGLLIGLQAYANIGVNMGALPTKGLTLPLVSYGGNSMIVSCVAFGLLLRIERESRRARRGPMHGT